MSTNLPPDRPASRPKSKVKIGLQADFEQMLSSLPDDGSGSELESETVPDEAPAEIRANNRPVVGLQADFSQMLSDLPTAPEDTGASTVEEEDFRARRKGPQFAKPASPAPAPSGPAPTEEPVAREEWVTDEAVADEVAEEEVAGDEVAADEVTEAPVSAANVAKKVEHEPAPALKQKVKPEPPAKAPKTEERRPANIFGINEDEAAFYLRERETVVDEPERESRPVRKRTAPATTTGFPPPAAAQAPPAEASITDLILAELEKYQIPAASQLRIAVHGGAVTIIGDVPGDYEKQLIVHFCKKVPGVTEVTDMMRTVGGSQPAPAAAAAAPGGKKASRSFAAVPRKAPKAPPKNWKPSGATLQLPFRAKHVGIAVGLVAMVWAGFTFATRDGSRLSVSPVTGKITVDGVPAEGASVILHPSDPGIIVRPRGAVGADGTFKLTTYLPGDGAPAGDYKITVEWCKMIETPQGEPMPGPNLLPTEWSKPETTIHKVTVSGRTEIPPIEVTK